MGYSIGLLVWVLLGIFGATAFFAHIQRGTANAETRKQYYKENANTAFAMVLMGAVVFAMSFIMSEKFKYGFLFPYSKKSKIEAGLV